MTIDATLPLGTDLVSALDTYIREDREQINDLWTAVVAANCTETTHEMGAGEFALAIGTDLEDVIIELVNLTAAVAVDLMQITNGSAGMIKVIRFGDADVTVKHNASYIDLANDTDITTAAGDILVLVNKGGDPDTSVNGVWYEVARAGSSTGEVNTASNVGGETGELFKQKTDVDLEFKTIGAGTGISVTNNASDVEIASTAVNTSSNVGSGTGTIYKQKTGVDLELKTLKEGNNITITNNASDITISAATGASGTNSYAAATLGVGDTELVGGVDVTDDPINQIVYLTAAAAETLEEISNCTAGAVLHIIAGDNNISITRGAKMEIRQPAADPTINLSTGDVITIMNIGGAPGVSDGVWHEISRSLVVT